MAQTQIFNSEKYKITVAGEKVILIDENEKKTEIPISACINNARFVRAFDPSLPVQRYGEALPLWKKVTEAIKKQETIDKQKMESDQAQSMSKVIPTAVSPTQQQKKELEALFGSIGNYVEYMDSRDYSAFNSLMNQQKTQGVDYQILINNAKYLLKELSDKHTKQKKEEIKKPEPKKEVLHETKTEAKTLDLVQSFENKFGQLLTKYFNSQLKDKQWPITQNSPANLFETKEEGVHTVYKFLIEDKKGGQTINIPVQKGLEPELFVNFFVDKFCTGTPENLKLFKEKMISKIQNSIDYLLNIDDSSILDSVKKTQPKSAQKTVPTRLQEEMATLTNELVSNNIVSSKATTLDIQRAVNAYAKTNSEFSAQLTKMNRELGKINTYARRFTNSIGEDGIVGPQTMSSIKLLLNEMKNQKETKKQPEPTPEIKSKMDWKKILNLLRNPNANAFDIFEIYKDSKGFNSMPEGVQVTFLRTREVSIEDLENAGVVVTDNVRKLATLPPKTTAQKAPKKAKESEIKSLEKPKKIQTQAKKESVQIDLLKIIKSAKPKKEPEKEPEKKEEQTSTKEKIKQFASIEQLSLNISKQENNWWIVIGDGTKDKTIMGDKNYGISIDAGDLEFNQGLAFLENLKNKLLILHDKLEYPEFSQMFSSDQIEASNLVQLTIKLGAQIAYMQIESLINTKKNDSAYDSKAIEPIEDNFKRIDKREPSIDNLRKIYERLMNLKQSYGSSDAL
ncbi:MAG: hypothetical protein WC501_04765 [Candidatus Micrarchaeia archaeon]